MHYPNKILLINDGGLLCTGLRLKILRLKKVMKKFIMRFWNLQKMLCKSMAEIEEIEPEPSLGNGGLGRLAACFLDSIATLGLAGDGIGLNYHLGLFKQEFENNLQKEVKNPWIEKQSWLRRTGKGYTVCNVRN